MKSRSVAALGLAVMIAAAGFGLTAFRFSPNLIHAAHPDSTTKIIYGDEQPLGEGTVRTWVRLGSTGEPESLGITVSNRAVETLPDAESLPEPFHMYNLELSLPAEAAAAGFDHVLFDWNAVGHEPHELYSKPHFDVHFYLIDSASRKAMNPSDPEFEAKGLKEPAADLIPVDYISPPGNIVVPEMGTHWLDRHAPELNGQPFSQTMLYGFYDGKMIFIEPMLTIEYLKTNPNLVQELKQPKRFERPGYYPTRYVIRADEAEDGYVIAIEGLKRHTAHTSHVH